MLSTPTYIFTLILGIWVLSLVGCIVLGIACYRLLADRGRLLLRMEQVQAQTPGPYIGGMQEGAYLPDVSLPRATTELHSEPGGGAAVSRLIGSHEQSSVLMFLDSDCLYSRALARELSLRVAQQGHPGLIAIIGGDPPGSPDFPLFPGTLLLDASRQAAQLYNVTFTPSGYVVAPTRHTIGSLLVGPEALLQAIRDGARAGQLPNPLPVTPIPRDTSRNLPPLSTADSVPELTQVTASGETWSLGNYRGSPLMLLFIDPDCPPCQEALVQVATCTGMEIVVLSHGTLEEPVNAVAATLPGVTLLLQQQREAARAFRMLDVPAIYEVSADGIISSGPIIGLQQITRYVNDGICVYTQPGTSAAS